MIKIIKRCPALFLCLTLLLPVVCACGPAVTPEPNVPDVTTGTDKTDEKTEANYTYKTTLTEEELRCITVQDESYKVLVNKQHTIGADYAAADIIALDTAVTKDGKEINLNETAATALYAMLREMAADGIKNVCVTSAYRSYAYQNWLYEYYISDELTSHPGWTREQAEELVLTYSAKPGTSEHHTGLCVDLWVDGMRELENYGDEGDYSNDVGFAETEAYSWLCKNAYRFGFILRYPEGKEEITGYQYESWHWRFVGRETAAAIAASGITLEEYLNQ